MGGDHKRSTQEERHMVRYIAVSVVSGILFGVLDGLINANPLGTFYGLTLKPAV